MWHDAARRILKKVRGIGQGGCWEGAWAPTNERGTTVVEGRSYTAARVVWEALVGAVPPGLLMLHKCDIPRCVNPAHLYVGTRRDNTRDLILRGPRGRGWDSPVEEKLRAWAEGTGPSVAQTLLQRRRERRPPKNSDTLQTVEPISQPLAT
jgi:hypothetical protein